jgi:hypothetical protein
LGLTKSIGDASLMRSADFPLPNAKFIKMIRHPKRIGHGGALFCGGASLNVSREGQVAV